MHLITSQMNIKFFIYRYIRIIDSGICIGYKPSPSAFILPNTMILKLTSFNICHNFSILLITSISFQHSPNPFQITVYFHAKQFGNGLPVHIKSSFGQRISISHTTTLPAACNFLTSQPETLQKQIEQPIITVKHFANHSLIRLSFSISSHTLSNDSIAKLSIKSAKTLHTSEKIKNILIFLYCAV